MIPGILMSAIVYGSLITILSIGYTLTYLTSKIPNFAHGTYAAFGIYVSFTFAKVYGISPYLGFPVAFLVGGVMGIILYIIVINTLEKIGGGQVVLTISTIAIQIFIGACINVYATYIRMKTGQYAYNFLLKSYDFKFMGFQGLFPVSFIICISTIIFLYFLLNKTKTGIAMRAISEDPELSSILGIDTNFIQILSWFMTGGLASFAGAMIPMWFLSTPTTGNILLISIMAGSLLGGLDYIYGALIGGFSVGFSEILLTYWMQGIFGTWIGEYRPLVPMIFVIGVLLIEPRGLGGLIRDLNIPEKIDQILRGSK